MFMNDIPLEVIAISNEVYHRSYINSWESVP